MRRCYLPTSRRNMERMHRALHRALPLAFGDLNEVDATADLAHRMARITVHAYRLGWVRLRRIA